VTPLYVHGIGHSHPSNVITNQFLEDLDIGTSCAWIEERLGIRERRTALSLEYIRATKNSDLRAALEATEFSNTDASVEAATMAIHRARIDVRQIGLIISGSSCPIHSSPPEACILADRLGISPVAFDTNAACNGFLTHSSVAKSWLLDNDCDFGLIVQAEHMTRTVDYAERTNASLMGDGTAATVVSAKYPSSFQLAHIKIASVPKFWDAAIVASGKHFTQRTGPVREFAVKHLAEGIPSDHESFVIFHQAHLRLLEGAFQTLKLPSRRHLFNVDRFGNCAAAGCASVISENWDFLLSQSDPVALSTIGGGLAYGSGLLSRTLET
jgi:3-oxoacyl-[acyl-carrier-protein] synthase-3